MKKLILIILATITLATPTMALKLDISNLSHIQKLSIATIKQMSREDCYKWIDNSFQPLQLINYLKNKEVQKKIYDYCQKKGVPYSIVLITFYKESSYRADAWHQYADGSADVGIAQTHIKAKDMEKESSKQIISSPMVNMYDGIYRIWQIMERYEAYTLLEINIAYQYGFTRLYEASEGIPVPKAQVFLNGLERGEEYVEKMIKRAMIKQVVNDGATFIKKDSNTLAPLPLEIDY